MIALIQRVSSASVAINGDICADIGTGILALIAVQKEDSHEKADKLLQKILTYRIFADENDNMNLSLQQVGGGLLLVSQFTLAADTRKGRRPGFSAAASPALAQELYEYLTTKARQQHPLVETGIFAADMQVSLVNDGPVTFYLET